jgi:polyisoprenoid-binding protein YceI
MRTIILSTLLAAASLYGDCQYTTHTSKVTWKAFKTYEKIGVGGTFDTSRMVSKTSSSVDTLLSGSTIAIETLSVNSGNPGRDATLGKAFFKAQNVESIHAKIQSAKEGKAMVEITMNGINRVIPMTYAVSGNTVTGKGVIDLADFGMLESLSSINKACFDLHAGKTWQDVEIGFEIQLDQKCS